MKKCLSIIAVVMFLMGLSVIAEEAAREGYIRPEDVSRLIRFRNNPSDESWAQL